MKKIKNAANKLVCRLDKQQKLVEIVQSGYKTTIRFFEDGRIEIRNTIVKIA